MSSPSEPVIDRIKVREVAGVLRSPDEVDTAIGALLLAGFDRSDIDLMAGVNAVRERLGDVYVPAEELADIPGAPRRGIFVAREDVTNATALTAGLLSYVGATATALGIVASGGSLALALAAAAAGGGVLGGIGWLMGRTLGQGQADELEAELVAGGIVIWVRVRSPEQEERAQLVLKEHGAQAIRVHEIEIEKRLEDLPLSSINPDPLLEGERIGKI